MNVAAIIALLGPLLPSAVAAAQKLFGSVVGPAKAATDAAKLQSVTSAVTPFLQALATAGKTPGAVIPADVEAAIEAVLAAMKVTGAVSTNTPVAVVPAATGTSYKLAGTLTVG